MSTHRDNELGAETVETGNTTDHEHRLESLDDIPREIAERRLHTEFGEDIPDGKMDAIRETPDKLEPPEDFEESARKAGIEDTTGLLGWATSLDAPAHVKKGEVAREIGTLAHEDLHRLTHPETREAMTESPALRAVYEGITQYLAENAVEGLHEFRPGEVYPEHVEAAKRLEAEVGETALRDWFFKHELNDEVRKALDRIERTG